MSLPLRITAAFLLILIVVLGSVIPSLSPASREGSDLWIHATVYGGLVIAFAALFGSPARWAVFLFLFSVAVEGLQAFLPARVASWSDIMANAAGITTGLALVGAIALTPLWSMITSRLRTA